MADHVVVEICVESVEHAIAAERGGADRIELCAGLSCGGVTPILAQIEAARRQVRIPIHVLIRPRAGDFCYSEAEVETMKRDIQAAKEAGIDGVVLGLLDAAQQVDQDRTRALAQLAHPVPVTFHRAFDQCADLDSALPAVMAIGATRILTSGGKANALDGLANLERLVASAAGRIVVMPGGGVRLENAERILRHTGAREIHTSLDASLTSPVLFEGKVREFVRALANVVPGSI